MRIVAFVGSPIVTEEKELVKLAKRLKKEKVNVDIVSFGEEVSPWLQTIQVDCWIQLQYMTDDWKHGRHLRNAGRFLPGTTFK